MCSLIKVCNLFGLFVDPFLNSRVMFASFHSEGHINPGACFINVQ